MNRAMKSHPNLLVASYSMFSDHRKFLKTGALY